MPSKDLKRIIVVSPHPDDETLGAGGTLLKMRKLGHRIYWLNVTNMESRYGFADPTIDRRRDEMERVSKDYGFSGSYDLRLKPAGLKEYRLEEIIAKISRILKRVKPHVVIMPFKHDAHTDHGVVFDAVSACTKSFRYPFIKTVLMMEILSETNFSSKGRGFFPNYFVDISDHLEKKIQIMRTYKGELKRHPFPRSEKAITALGILRGGQAGCRYAEGFMLAKHITKEVD